MKRIEFKWLLLAAALAVGEGVGIALSRGAAAWPFFLGLAALVALLGFGYRWRAWPMFAVFFLGLSIVLAASSEREAALRLSPWLRDRSVVAVSSRPLIGDGWCKRVRATLSRRVGLGLDSARESALLNRAILLGERDGIPKATKATFVASGTVHIFAISGLHVMIVARVFMFLLALLFVPLWLQGALSMPLIWGYVLLIGAPPSAVRAALMASVYFAAPLFSRRSDGLIAWAFAFLLVHLVNPLQIGDVGSQFSFVVMLALILAGRFGGIFISSRGKVFFLTAMAWAAGVPIAAVVFERVTPGGMLANLVLLIAASYSVVAGTLGIIASFTSSFLAFHLNNFSALMTDAMVVVSDCVAKLPGANFEVRAWTIGECALWYLAMGLVLYLVYHIRERQNLI